MPRWTTNSSFLLQKPLHLARCSFQNIIFLSPHFFLHMLFSQASLFASSQTHPQVSAELLHSQEAFPDLGSCGLCASLPKHLLLCNVSLLVSPLHYRSYVPSGLAHRLSCESPCPQGFTQMPGTKQLLRVHCDLAIITISCICRALFQFEAFFYGNCVI